ncbi:MAG: hypothetical protein ABI315_06375 [Bacteroidia bacterium]
MKIKFAFIALLFGLNSGVYSQSTKEPKKIDKKDVPKEVLITYNEMYPDVILGDLYNTPFYDWSYDYYKPWYNDWYDDGYWGYYPYNDAVEYEYIEPENYEIDFTKGGMSSRALYGPSGKWIETRTEIKELPTAILDAAKKTEYGQWDKWKIAKHLEKVESPSFTGAHYRVAYRKGLTTHVITFDNDGKIISKKKMEKKK